jgi:NADP-dependent 3-hydroxy acid dehydrogenase YdfG
MEKRVALVVGASSGFGKEAALALLAKGLTVYAAARRLEPMAEIGRAGGRLLAMDVTSDASVKDAIATLLAETGRIDVVLNNAGYGAYGAVETVPLDEVVRQFDVNLFGMARVNNAVLPAMRAQRSGRIIFSASLASHISAPGTGWYSATKHAVKAMAEALRSEVASLGIFVVQIEPGPVRTGFERVAFEAMDHLRHPHDYAQIIGGFRHYMTRSYAKAPGPGGTVKAMVDAAVSPHPRAVYRTTLDAKALPAIRTLLGGALFGTVLRSLFLRSGARE